MAFLVKHSVPRTLVSMAVPMLAGTFAMNAFNLTDTWFVSRLGTLPLAAMGFTFPVIMLFHCFGRGIATGVTALMSHAIGRHDHEQAARLTTHGTILIGATVGVLTLLAWGWIDPIFTSLGADADVLPLIRQYMEVWFFGTLMMSIPMLGNGVLISMGDAKSASAMIILVTLVNLVLDPIFIFGLGGIPAMGLRGAALATVIGHTIGSLWVFRRLGRKHHLWIWTAWPWRDLLHSARRIAAFAIPGILSMILLPISATVITVILSRFGNDVIAAAGAAGRIEMFAFMIPMALGMSLTPFVSQNFGAGRGDRLTLARRVTTRFAILYGVIMTVGFYLGAPFLASVFTEDTNVAENLILYIRITSFGYGMMEVHRYSGFFLTGMHHPTQATLLNVVRVLVLLIPLSWLGSQVAAVTGVFVGRLAADIFSGGIGIFWVGKILRKTKGFPERE